MATKAAILFLAIGLFAVQASATLVPDKTPDAEEAEEPLNRADRIRLLQRQLIDLDNLARAQVLRARGVNPLPRPAINAGYNVDEFEPVTTRFVRFTILATLDGMEPCIDELELYGPGSKVNLARSKGTKATASSLLPGYPIHQIHHLIDGTYGNSNSWISNQPGKGWVQIELASPARVSRIVWSRDADEPVKFRDRVPSKYEIAVSNDGEYWKQVGSDASRTGVNRWFSNQNLFRALDADQQKKWRNLEIELKKLRE